MPEGAVPENLPPTANTTSRLTAGEPRAGLAPWPRARPGGRSGRPSASVRPAAASERTEAGCAAPAQGAGPQRRGGGSLDSRVRRENLF